MADLTVIEGGAPLVVDQVLEVDPDQVHLGQRLRPIDPVWAEALAAIIKVEGQKTPIEVCKLPGKPGWRLVVGGHRLAACRILGRPVRMVIGSADALQRRRTEISENIWRRGLDPIDRAAFVAELHEVLRAEAGVDPGASPQQLAVTARWAKERATDTADMMSAVYGFTDSVAGTLGLNARTIRRDLELHRGLRPDVVAKLRGLPIAGNAGQLRALAKLTEADQRAAVGLIIGGKAKGATEALAILRQKPKPDPETKAWSAFFGGWSRMSARRRREALRELAEQGLPTGVSLTFTEAANV